MVGDFSDYARRLDTLERNSVSAREADLERQVREKVEASLADDLKEVKESQKWAFRFAVGAFLGIVSEVVIFVLYLVAGPKG